MSKDPAFVFYSSDFLTGVMDLTMEERGQYITLLCLQHQKGRFCEKVIKVSVGHVSEDVMKKFKVDENGLFYNERLELEVEKRLSFKEKQRENGKLGGRPKKAKENPSETQKKAKLEAKHKPKKSLLEDDNDNENEDINKKENNYFEDMGLNYLFLDYLDVRKKKKVPNTDRAITLLLNKLNKHPDDVKREMLENAIVGGWQSLYEPEKKAGKKNGDVDWSKV